MSSLRPGITILASLVLATTLGCSIFEELDNAAAMLQHDGSEKKSETAKAAEEEPEKKGIDWTKSRSLHAGEIDASIVRCSFGNSVQFMRVDDCRLRGGTPGKI
jgi:hypothetical protein